MAPRRSSGPLLSFSDRELRTTESSIFFNSQTITSDPDIPQKRWYHYLPLCGKKFIRTFVDLPTLLKYFSIDAGTVTLILAPHPSLLYVLVDFHLQTLHQPIIFMTHLIITYTLTFMAFSSLIVCVARDPGPANQPPSRLEMSGDGEDDIGLTEALMPDRDFSFPERWCRKCWVGIGGTILILNMYSLTFAYRHQGLKGPTTVQFAIDAC